MVSGNMPPRLVGQGRELAHQLAVRGHLDALGARRAAQPMLHRLFEPVLADLEARGDQQSGFLFSALYSSGWASPT